VFCADDHWKTTSANSKFMTVDNERESWNRRYREGSHGSMEPDPFLVQAYEDYIQPLFPRSGRALDVAGGVGRHAIWLARRGWRVTLSDISEVGLSQARENAGDLADQIEFIQGDMKKFRAARSRFDLVLVFFYLERSVFPHLVKALRPGGLLLYKTYTLEQRKFKGGPSHPLHLLKINELLNAFDKLRVLQYRETIRERGVAELVAQNV
jgi:tellurite methyltransferase